MNFIRYINKLHWSKIIYSMICFRYHQLTFDRFCATQSSFEAVSPWKTKLTIYAKSTILADKFMLHRLTCSQTKDSFLSYSYFYIASFSICSFRSLRELSKTSAKREKTQCCENNPDFLSISIIVYAIFAWNPPSLPINCSVRSIGLFYWLQPFSEILVFLLQLFQPSPWIFLLVGNPVPPSLRIPNNQFQLLIHPFSWVPPLPPRWSCSQWLEEYNNLRW